MGRIRSCATSFKEADELLQGRSSKRKKVHGNTYLERCGNGDIALRLHCTNVVMFRPDGTVVLDSGGWMTVTTKERINMCLPDGWHLSQDDSVWYVNFGYRDPGKVWIFRDGMAIKPDGSVEGAAPTGKARESRKLKQAVSEYVHGYMTALFNGEVPKPSGGDCWYCGMQTQDGKPLGEATSNHGEDGHVRQHVIEGYYVPSLLTRAIEVLPVSMVAKATLNKLWGFDWDVSTKNPFSDGSDWGELARDQLGKSLKRYVCRQVGLAA